MKRWIKIALSLLLSCCCLFSMAACGRPDTGKTDDQNQNQSQGQGDHDPDPTAVPIGLSGYAGLDREKFDSEILYNEPAQADYVFDATEYGVTADDDADDSAAIQRIIEEIKTLAADKTKVIKLPSGRLDFIELKNPVNYNHALFVEGIDNLSIVGNDTEIMVWGTIGFYPFQFTNCKNLLVKGISVDWGNLPFVMGTVESFDIDNKTAVIQVNEGYLLDGKTEVYEYLEYDKNTNVPRAGGNFLHNEGGDQISSTEYLEGNKLRLTFSGAVTEAPVGTKVACCFTMRFNTTFFVDRCENVRFESVNLYASPGMGLLARSNRNLYFNAFRIICKPGTDRLMTTTSDMMHLKGNMGEIVITNSQLENGYDDAVNVCANYLSVGTISGNSVTAVSPGGMHETYAPVIGEKMEIIDKATGESKGILTVKTSELTENGYTMTFEESDLSSLAVGNYLAMGEHTVSFTMKNSIVRNKRNRGLLIQTQDVLIENCVFSAVQHGPVLIQADLNGSIEGVIPKDVTIRNCKFYNNSAYALADITVAAYVNGGYGKAGTIQNIAIENNFFAYGRSSVLDLKGVSGLSFKNNYVYLPALAPYYDQNNCCFNFMNVSGITIENSDFTHSNTLNYMRAFVTGTMDTETLVVDNNNNLERSDFIAVVGEYDVVNEDVQPNWGTQSIEEFDGIGTQVKMAAATTVEVGKVEIDSIDPDDFSADTRLVWDNEGIYIIFSVVDDEISFNTTSFWLGDGLEIFMTDETTSGEDFSSIMLDGHDTLQLFVWAADGVPALTVAEGRCSESVMAGKDKILAECWLTDNGYEGKVFIPFEIIPKIKEAIDAGKQISLSCNYGESDPDKGAMFKTISCVDHPTSGNKMYPSAMTKFTFIQGE